MADSQNEHADAPTAAEQSGTPRRANVFSRVKQALVTTSDAQSVNAESDGASTETFERPVGIRTISIAAPLRTAYLAGLGVLLAVVTGTVLQHGSTILIYIGLSLFLALGLDPVVSWVERRVPRGGAVGIVFGIIVIIFGLILLAIVPVIVNQVTYVVTHFPTIVNNVVNSNVGTWVQDRLAGSFDITQLSAQVINFVKDPQNILSLGGGVLSVGANVASGISGSIIVLILTLYFLASLTSMKRAFVRCFPAYRRTNVATLTEDISRAVGRYVIGQVFQGAINGVLSFIFLSIVRAPFPALLAMIAFFFSLMPLVGTLASSVIITLVSLFTGPVTAIIVGVYYLVYMQVEAYVINPRIMNRAVSVPGAVVVIAAAAGGTLGGILGALVAIPIAASILIIIQKVVFPAQDRQTQRPETEAHRAAE